MGEYYFTKFSQVWIRHSHPLPASDSPTAESQAGARPTLCLFSTLASGFGLLPRTKLPNLPQVFCSAIASHPASTPCDRSPSNK